MQKFLSSLLASAFLMTASFPALAADGAAMKPKKTLDIACVKTAIVAREDALISGWSVFNSAVVAAYTARKAALDAAWSNMGASARKAAVKAAWDAFRKSKQAAAKQWQSTRQTSWKNFRAAAKACGAPADTDAGGEAMDQ